MATYSYTSRNNFLDTLAYGNGDSVKYTYDKQGRVTKQTYEDGDTVSYKYDNNGALATITDSGSGITTSYHYDFSDRLMKYKETANGYSHIVGYEYDEINNLTTLVETINGTSRTTSYTYDDDNRVTGVTTQHPLGNVNVSITYDAYGRISTLNNGVFTKTYNYRTVDGKATAQIESVTHTAIQTNYEYEHDYSYEYDANGNITSATFGKYTNTYSYDSSNQLVRENNQRKGFTQTWTYDDAGNILTNSQYAYTTGTLGTPTQTITYSYDDSAWGDLLTGYNGQTITYDAIGNPLTYKDANGNVVLSYTWEHGRQLKSMTKNGVTWNYTYNADGLRTGRTNGTDTYEYYYNGDQLTRMVYNGVVVDIIYAGEIPVAMTYNGEIYYYFQNGQGDIIGLTDSEGNLVLGYTYRAYGVPTALLADPTLSQTLYQYNPLLYRGYVGDVDTGMFYLQSRYYTPNRGRFINADALVSTGQGLLGNNMFAYCNNNPVRYRDSLGTEPKETLYDGELDEELIPGRDGIPADVYEALQNVSGSLSHSYPNTYSNQGNAKSYSSYSSLKSDIGSAGANQQWHHVVEQYQLVNSGFSTSQIQNTSNIVSVYTSDHYIISGFYSSKQFFTNGLTVRQWLSGHSYEFQREFGIALLGG